MKGEKKSLNFDIEISVEYFEIRGWIKVFQQIMLFILHRHVELHTLTEKGIFHSRSSPLNEKDFFQFESIKRDPMSAFKYQRVEIDYLFNYSFTEIDVILQEWMKR